jgi:hypothetical protein
MDEQPTTSQTRHEDSVAKFLDNQKHDKRKEIYYRENNMFLIRIDHTVNHNNYETIVRNFFNDVCNSDIYLIRKIGERYDELL